MKGLMVIIVGIEAVGFFALFMLTEFNWHLKNAKFRWSLAIIGFLFEMALAGGLAYFVIRYCPPIL